MLHIADLVRLFSSRTQFFGLIDLQVQKGSASARADDTKSLKGAVLDWITPRGGSLVPPLARNIKFDRGFHHDRTGALLCPTNLNWSDSK
jgi:hypothetical protein